MTLEALAGHRERNFILVQIIFIKLTENLIGFQTRLDPVSIIPLVQDWSFVLFH